MSRFAWRMLLSICIFVAGIWMHYIDGTEDATQLVVFLAGYLIIGYDVVVDGLKGLTRGQALDENLLMVIATVAAFMIGEYPEAMTVMMFFQVGEWFEHRAVNRTRKSISELMDIQPEYATVIRDGTPTRVEPCMVQVGELIEVRPGERIPLDGIIVTGSTSVDTRALTGESLPRDLAEGDEVISGTVNISSLITVRVTRMYQDSTVAKVLELVEDSFSRKSTTERFITRFARVYTPAVVLCAFLVAAIPICLGYPPYEWVYKAIVFLVVSCPCALIVSVPLSYYCAIGAASSQGVLVKGSNYLEALAETRTVVFDKTGTLTEGRFRLDSIDAVDITEEELLSMAAHAESVSNHPIARSIVEGWNGTVDRDSISDVEEVPGVGIRAHVRGMAIEVGNRRVLPQGMETHDDVHDTCVFVVVDGTYRGCIHLSDHVKDKSHETIASLGSMGIGTVMLSGDTTAIAERIGSDLGIGRVEGELLPSDKISRLEGILSETDGSTVFVGDGINDAPSLAMSDVGIAMGGMGSDAAIEAADIVIMDDDTSKIVDTIRLSRRTRSIVMQNIVFALMVKFGVMVISLLGFANMWLAVFGDVGVAVIAILNAMRCQSSIRKR